MVLSKKKYRLEHGKVIRIKTVTFEPVAAKYVKIEVTNGKNGYASAAEVEILGY
ncbi:Bacillolysin [Bacillus mycoides]|nr:Bacillolysin [Bacillus mycoides]